MTIGRVRTVVIAIALGLTSLGAASDTDPRLREVTYDAAAVVTVPVRRGVVTHIVLGADEAITEVGAGLGGDCGKAESAWCIAAQPGGRHLFVKPKSGAEQPNNLAIVTDRRVHALRFVVLPDHSAQAPVYRLTVRAPPARTAVAARPVRQELLASLAPPGEPPPAPPPPPPAPEAVVAERLQAAPPVVNADYSIAEGEASADIVPSLVFDDGRFTYLRFAGNREVPAVFHVLGDGSETLVNTRMEDDLLVVDRVSARLMLRAGRAVVGVWNEAFDLEGVPPAGGTTVPGVQRVIRFAPGSPPAVRTDRAAPAQEP
jgi:type IV secretion system protein VirB9